MSRYEPEPLPIAPPLSEVLEREHERIADGLRHRLDLEPERAEDIVKPQEGMFRYFDANVYDPGQGTGPYIFSGGEWRRLIEWTDALQIFSFAGYAGAYADPPVSVSIGGGWETLPWSDISVSIPRGVSVDTAANTFAIALDGVWAFSVSGTFGHNDSNQGRFFFARLFNVTTGTPSVRTFRLFTGRNSDGTPFAWNFLAEVTEAQKNDDWRIEFGNATGSYTGADWQGELSLWNVGEWREPIALV